MTRENWYFNKGIYLKNIGRFWPIWGAYLVIWLALMPLRLGSQLNYAAKHGFMDLSDRALSVITSGNGQPILFMVFFFSAFMAMAIFRYLCTPASVGFYHSLPIRREGLFISGWLSGMTMLVGSNLITFAAMLLVGASWGVPVAWPAFLWFLSACILSVFFFSFAVFCAQFTGNTIALPIFYGILSVLAVVVYYIIRAIMEDVIYGLVGESGLIFTIVQWISPPVYLYAAGFGPVRNYAPDIGSQTCTMLSASYQIGLFIAGLIFALLALLVYKRRRSETAEDIVSVAAVRPVFKYGVAFCAAITGGMAMTYLLYDEFRTQTFGIFMVICGIVFYLAAEMLLKKSFRVFSRKSLSGCGVFTVIMIVLFTVCLKTGFGVENRIPPASQVEAAYVSNYSYSRYIQYAGYSYNTDYMLEYVAEDTASIESVRSLHRLLLDRKGEAADDYYAESRNVYGTDVYIRDTVSIWISYQMKNGAAVERRYVIPVTSELLAQEDSTAYVVQTLFDKDRTIPRWFAPEGLENVRIYQAAQDYHKYYEPQMAEAEVMYQESPEVVLTQAKARRLMEAVEADLKAGNIGRSYLLRDERYYEENYLVEISFSFRNDRDYSSFTLTVSKSAAKTIAVLEELGVTEECPLISLSDLIAAGR